MLKSIFNNLINLVYPKQCLICKETTAPSNSDSSVCINCWAKIQKNLPPFCQICGRHLEIRLIDSNICPKCRRTNYNFDRAFSPCLYQGTVKDLIHFFKYKGKIYLGKQLAGLLIEFIKNYRLPIDMIDMIVPIPLHKRKLREREFNQAEILATYVAETSNKKISCNNLYRIRDNLSQITLSDAKRWENVKGIFKSRNPTEFKDKTILLVDDVFTTGATASEAAFVLKKAGAKGVFVLTIAN